MSDWKAEIGHLAEQVRVNGYALLENAMPVEKIEAMRMRFMDLLQAYAQANPTNRGAQRYQMYLPWEAPFTDPDLYLNERVLAVVEAVMGKDPALVYFASDTPLPGSDFQPVHSDTRLLFPETCLSLPAYGLVVNVPLVDCDERNGSLEFWPGGTHLMPGPADLPSLALRLPVQRANMKVGSVLIRDLRMWHRGTPNRSQEPRPHLALVYVRPWYRFEQAVPALARSEFEALPERGRQLLRFAKVVD